MPNWQKPASAYRAEIYEICMKLSIAAICSNTRFGNSSTEKDWVTKASLELVNTLAIRKAKNPM
jgi:hypothetical protein